MAVFFQGRNGHGVADIDGYEQALYRLIAFRHAVVGFGLGIESRYLSFFQYQFDTGGCKIVGVGARQHTRCKRGIVAFVAITPSLGVEFEVGNFESSKVVVEACVFPSDHVAVFHNRIVLFFVGKAKPHLAGDIIAIANIQAGF